MTNAQLFTAAHKLTKEVIETGDSYSATFSLCLSFVISKDKLQNKVDLIKKETGCIRVFADNRYKNPKLIPIYSVEQITLVSCLMKIGLGYCGSDVKEFCEATKDITIRPEKIVDRYYNWVDIAR